MPVKSVLFVCLGNICRSPLAEAIFKQLAQERGLKHLDIDSAGTSGWHAGERADPRSREVAARNGVQIHSRSRPVREDDFHSFDLLLAMDAANLRELQQRCPEDQRHKLRLMREWDPLGPGDVPDPYYGGPSGFDDNFQMLRRSCQALLDEMGV